MQIHIQNKIIQELKEANACTEETSIRLSNVRKGINFNFLIRNEVIVQGKNGYYLNEVIWDNFKNYSIKRIFPFL